MVDDRKLDVLRAIVEDYVATEEPVGSKALVERHGLGVSPATVRNDMAALEDEGYIHQPHTSAGRVPDRQGLPALRRQARHAQADERGGAPGDRDAARRGGRPRRRRAALGAAAQPAHPPGRDRAVPVALALARSATSSWSSLTPTRVMVILILSTGRVEQRLVELDDRDGRRATSPSCGSRSTRPAAGVQIADGRRRARRPARRRTPRAGRLHPRDRGRAHRRDVRPPQRRAGRGRRHRQPRPLRRHSTPPSGRCSRRWRSTSCCSSCWGSRATDARDGAHRPRRPLLRARRHQRRGHRLRPAGFHLGSARRRRPDPHGLPRIHGSRARRRALRLPDPR